MRSQSHRSLRQPQAPRALSSGLTVLIMQRLLSSTGRAVASCLLSNLTLPRVMTAWATQGQSWSTGSTKLTRGRR
jgi:hypothetical protein